jgi:integrase
MSARIQSTQRYKRCTPVYEFKGFEIRVYRSQNRFSAQFRNSNNIRERVERDTEGEAVEAAKNLIRQLSDTEVQATVMENSSAELLLKPTGISLIEAARIVVTSVARLQSFSIGIPQAIDYYLASHTGKPIQVAALVEELIAVKERDTGIHNKKDLVSKLKNGFCKSFGSRFIGSILASELTVYVTSYPGAKRTRRNQHSALVTLFEYAKDNGYLPRGIPTQMDSVKKPKANKPIKNIFTPDELIALIRAGLAINSRALCALLIQAFAGVRTEELRQSDPRKDRLRWSDIWLNQAMPEIHIRIEVSKNDEERFIPIPPMLVKWLRLLRLTDDAPVYPVLNLFGDYRLIVKKAGLKWKKNGLRKAFNTYNAALSGSFHVTSKAAGNSASMIGRYYNKPTSQVSLVATKWFSIGPEKFGEAPRRYASKLNISTKRRK